MVTHEVDERHVPAKQDAIDCLAAVEMLLTDAAVESGDLEGND